MSILQRLKKQDWLITIILVIFSFLSVSIIFSTTYAASNPQEGEGSVIKQLVFFIIGFICYFILAGIDLSWLKQKGVIIVLYVFIVGCLIYLLVNGELRADTQRWIFLGPLSFQPAEFAKLVIAIVTAYIFTYDYQDISLKQRNLDFEQTKSLRYRFILRTLVSLLTLIPVVALIYLQPSLGNALIISAIWAIIYYMVMPISGKSFTIASASLLALLAYYEFSFFGDIANASYLNDISWKIFVIVCLVATIIAIKYLFKANKLIIVICISAFLLLGPVAETIGNALLKDYQIQRVTTFFNPESIENVSQTSGYQVTQSKIAIGSGQINGTGYMQGKQSSLNALPFAHTDFIFAALAEQFGFIGVIVLFGLYGLLFWRMAVVFLTTNDKFGKLIVIGSIAIISINIFINTAMNIGLIPVTGVPLPLISAGGSSVWVIMISLGLVQMVNTSTKVTDFSEKFNWK